MNILKSTRDLLTFNNHDLQLLYDFYNIPVDLNKKDKIWLLAINILHKKGTMNSDEKELFKAIIWGNLKRVKELLQKGIDINVQDDNHTPLITAVHHNRLDIVKELIKAGANKEITDEMGNTALIIATSAALQIDGQNLNRADILKELIRADANVNHQNKVGDTALMYTVTVKSSFDMEERSPNFEKILTIMNILINAGANLDMKNNEGKTALLMAIEKKRVSRASQLLKAGADLNIPDIHNDMLLQIATLNNYKNLVIQLLEKGVDPNIQTNDGMTALMRASEGGYEKIAQLLLEKGADPNIKDNVGSTALLFASENGHEKIAQLLLEKGADPNIKVNFGPTALIYASEYGYEKIVQLLLEKGADPNIKAGNGDTALIRAIEKRHEKIAQLLLEKGADPNIKDKTNNTPLIIAVEKKYNIIMEELLKAGAKLDIVNSDGRTALSLADPEQLEILNKYKKTIEELLEEYPAISKIMEARRSDNISTEEMKTLLELLKTRTQKPIEPEPEQVYEKARDCTNDKDLFSFEDWGEDLLPEIKIHFDNGYTLCLMKKDVTNWVTDSLHHYLAWYPNLLRIKEQKPMDPTGHGGIGYSNEKFYSLPSLSAIFVAGNLNYIKNLLTNSSELRGHKIYDNKRLGQKGTRFGVSEIHGQEPGYPVYFLTAEENFEPLYEYLRYIFKLKTDKTFEQIPENYIEKFKELNTEIPFELQLKASKL